MKLIIMRSGECEILQSGGRDSGRDLIENGCEHIGSAAKFLSKLDISPEIILASPFRRTKHTAELLSSELPAHPPVENAPSIMPGAGVEELLRAVTNRAECNEDRWVAAVCHEPDISFILRSLLHMDNLNIPVESASLFGLELECSGGRSEGSLLFSFYPGSCACPWPDLSMK